MMPKKKRANVKKQTATTTKKLFTRKKFVPLAIKKAADVWIDCFLDYAKIIVEERIQGTTSMLTASQAMSDAREYADEALHTIQERWPEVEL